MRKPLGAEPHNYKRDRTNQESIATLSFWKSQKKTTCHPEGAFMCMACFRFTCVHLFSTEYVRIVGKPKFLLGNWSASMHILEQLQKLRVILQESMHDVFLVKTSSQAAWKPNHEAKNIYSNCFDQCVFSRSLKTKKRMWNASLISHRRWDFIYIKHFQSFLNLHRLYQLWNLIEMMFNSSDKFIILKRYWWSFL